MLKLMDKKIFTISNEFFYQAIIIPDIQRPIELYIENNKLYGDCQYKATFKHFLIISKDQLF